MSAEPIALHLVRGLLPERPKDAHKGTFGHLYVIAGSRGFTGAAKMTCAAAARSGAGLVTLGVPESLGDVVAAGLMETMTMLLPATRQETFSHKALEPALAFAEGKDAVALGPGISQHDDTKRFVRDFVRRCPAPMVIDADGLNAVADEPACVKDARQHCVLTPHPGEMARLTRTSAQAVQQDREGAAKAFAQTSECVVVLKGSGTVVADPSGEVFVNTTGNSGMASGGTGDVLTGLIGGLVAQGLSGLDAALLGVYAHGLAGDIAAKEKTERGLIATDLIDCIPNAWRAIEDGTAS